MYGHRILMLEVLGIQMCQSILYNHFMHTISRRDLGSISPSSWWTHIEQLW